MGAVATLDDPMMGIEVRDEDTDALATLPLAILPFKSVTLRGLLMVKNNSVESVVQMFDDDKTGSGQIKTMDLRQTIGSISTEDFKIVQSAAKLHSFDVYSLRISLRELGIAVNDTKYLKLSPAKQADLDKYVRPFTAKLVKAIYGDDSADAENVDISQMLKDPDVEKAKMKLKAIASKINIGLTEVPAFLEDYGDIYLSIAYYRNRLEQLDPLADEFIAAMDTIVNNQQLQTNPDIVNTAKKLSARVEKMREVLRGRFRLFIQSTNDMWNDMNAENFGEFKKMVEDNHAAVGGILCKLGVKMDAWNDKFPSRHTTGPNRFADFMMTDMRQGF